MTGPRIEVVNGRQVADALESLAAAAADMSDPTRVVLAAGMDAAHGQAPRLTGELIAGLDVVDVTATGGTLVARAPHSVYQEYGTRYVRGRHFMAAGSDAIHRAAADAYREDLAKKMRAAAQKA